MEQLGKYQLVRKLATGGMAEVYLAKSAGPRGFEKILVLKRILSHLAQDERFISMFLSEAKLAARLDHPNVVQIFDFGETDGEFYLAMEYIDGPTLRFVMRRAAEERVPLPLPFCAKVASLVCEGLAYAHDFCDPETGQWLGLVHRDVTPENILVSRSGAVKVVDFGIAKAAAISQTKSHSLRGKWGYLAPEQLRRKTLDRRVDIYALGVVLYELVTGQRHYDAASELEMMRAVLNERFVPASRRRPEVPPELDEIFERCLGQRDERYPTCHELQADLESFMRAQSGGTMTAAQLARVIADLNALPKGLSGYYPAVEVAAPEGARPTRPSPSIDPQAPLPSDRTPQVSVPLPDTLAIDGKGELVHAPHSTDVTVPDPALSEADVGTLRTATGGRRTRTDRVLSVVIGVLAALAAGLGTAAYWKRQQRASAPARPPPIVAPRPAPTPPPEPPPAPKPVLATFRVETEPAGDVRINGVFMGRSPVDIERPPGEVRIQVSDWKMGFRKEERFEVTEGKNGTLRVVVRRAPVELRIKPYAEVELDGRDLGRTEVARLELFEGLHTVHLVHRGLHKDLTLDVMVKPEEKNVFRFNMYR